MTEQAEQKSLLRYLETDSEGRIIAFVMTGKAKDFKKPKVIENGIESRQI